MEEVDKAIAYLDKGLEAGGLTLTPGLLLGPAIVYGPAMLFPKSVGQSDDDERKAIQQQQQQNQGHTEGEKKEQEAEPKTSTSGAGARKGTGRTGHGDERAAQARTGDAHRDVGDANRVVREGKEYTDTETGNTVHVNGNRVVIKNAAGVTVTQFKNSRANTQNRVNSGRWVPVQKPNGENQ